MAQFFHISVCRFLETSFVFLIFFSFVRSEFAGENVCEYNRRTSKLTRVMKLVKNDTLVPICHNTNSQGHCTEWHYFTYVNIPVTTVTYNDEIVLSCCLGFRHLDGRCVVCDAGTYGWQCGRKCSCPLNSTCNHTDGKCLCLPGLTGLSCDEECNDGFYGNNCTSECQCLTGENCNKVTGKCFHEAAGSSAANNTLPFYKNTMVFYPVIAASVAIIAIVIIAVVICTRRRRKRESNQRTANRGDADNYEMIRDHVLSNEYVDMDTERNYVGPAGLSVSDSGFQGDFYNEIHLENEEEAYAQVKERSASVDQSKLRIPNGDSYHGNYDEMLRPWERKDIENISESPYNHLENFGDSYDTFKSVKESVSMTSLPAHLDDNYSNVHISDNTEKVTAL